MTSSRRQRCDDGFTLMELLVAMTLLSLLTLVLYQSLHFGTRVWERSEISSGYLNKIRGIQLQIGEEIAQAYPMIVTNGTTSRLDFIGDKDRLAFLTRDTANPGSLKRIELSLRNDDGETSLVYAAQPELGKPKDRQERKLLEHVKSLTIRYFGTDSTDAPAAWHDSWHDKPSLPQMIRIGLTFENAAAADWPELVVAPRIAADVGCVFDSLTHFCRGR